MREEILKAIRDGLAESGIHGHNAEQIVQRIAVRVLHVIMSSHK